MYGNRWTYAGMMVLATLVAGVLLRRRQTALDLRAEETLGILLGGLCGATLAAKFPFVWSGTATAGLSLWLADGKTILWGLAGGYAGVELAKWALQVRTRTGDSFVVPLAVAIALGRLGCLLYGCCYGVPTDLPWGLRFVTAADAGTLARHPAQLYEMAFHLSAAAIALVAERRGVLRQRRMPAYLIAYAVYRFVSEFWRTEPAGLFGLTFYQWSAVPIAVGFLVVLMRIKPAEQPAASQGT